MVKQIVHFCVINILCTFILFATLTHTINYKQKSFAFLIHPSHSHINHKIQASCDKDTDLELAINKSTLDKLKDADNNQISGLNSSIDIKDFSHAVKGRLNEWNPSWEPGNKIMGFFPIIIDDLTNQPNPLQLGFEDTIRFRGKHVQSVFNSLLDKTEIFDINGEKQNFDAPVFGMCFLNVENGQLAPLAVYGALLDMKVMEGPRIETILVKTRVLGRVIIDKIIAEEPYIKATISPIEDKPGIMNPNDTKRTIDEIMKYHDKCNETEAEMMIKLEQHDGAEKIRSRMKLSEQLDNILPSFGIDPSNSEHLQAFGQLVGNIAFESHLIAAERYDALLLQNTEDRLLYVRNKLKAKSKQLEIINKSSKEELENLMKSIQDLQIKEGDVPANGVGEGGVAHDIAATVGTDENENSQSLNVE
ncbi:hypothetical protein BMR1_02g01330 [Babesia microti strain RI]|uniref:Uncharacterized protein n=1 Tax=Babesia microti (strain RI) TaxID=1133968 RepID=I7J625_BABMR|nr:hypothetical protein BMR1_02g01330 [Babesia microti strain RI]CCF73427.1 hypothetical protein BMR1_02g01330 [Babesia microti strain RI]|eukprot:XP_012648036.1 hypothetical protein BMR1_02g01330 [Babesia microti strain RI]